MAKPPRPQKRTAPGAGSPAVAVASADEFIRAASAFTLQIPDDRTEAANFGLMNPGGMVASATNLALGIELLMKALLLHHGRPVPHTHELPALFKDLPATVIKEIEDTYNRIDQAEAAAHRSMELVPMHGVSPASHPPVSDHSLRAVLQRNSNAFVFWRYGFEQMRNLSNVRFRYEIDALFNVANSLREQLGPVMATMSKGPT